MGASFAQRTIADLIVVLQVAQETDSRRRANRPSVISPAALREAAIVDENVLQGMREIRQAIEIGIVTACLAGQRDV